MSLYKMGPKKNFKNKKKDYTAAIKYTIFSID